MKNSVLILAAICLSISFSTKPSCHDNVIFVSALEFEPDEPETTKKKRENKQQTNKEMLYHLRRNELKGDNKETRVLQSGLRLLLLAIFTFGLFLLALNNTPEERRARKIMTILETVSVPTELQTTGSPQNLAAEWIIAQDSLKRCPDDEKFIQRYVMSLLYFSTEGASWLTCGENGTCGNANYLGSSHECEWFGNTCDMDQFLTSINIELNGLAGTIPFELEQLTNLFELRLEQGTTASTIPSQLGNLSNLISLDLDFNQLTGTIPEQIYDLTQLETLDLNDNQLTGTLSTSAGNLVNLQLFQVQENLLTGPIPASLGNAQTMLVAEFYNNDFTGAMPDEVCQIPTFVGLTSDCLGSPPQIECTCCTFCYA